MTDATTRDPQTEEVAGDGADRRSAQRVEVEMFVRERDGDRMFVHPALNLSATGIFLESHSYSLRSALDRQYIELEFELPDAEDAIAVRGEVVGTRRLQGFSTGLAIAFIDLSPEQHDKIARFVAERLEDGDSEGPRDEAAPTGS
ncbi:MAG: PilZ domain-containing protein [Deltaproteobacteria bacterium]|nr:PilZ domain-containing protein [Deltaproteobacteria bacterium]